jgi:ParB-like chromosome segregation protein Spo0J
LHAATSRKQVRQIGDSITAFGFLVPILIDEDGVVIAGHGRYAAAKLLGLQQVQSQERVTNRINSTDRRVDEA